MINSLDEVENEKYLRKFPWYELGTNILVLIVRRLTLRPDMKPTPEKISFKYNSRHIVMDKIMDEHKTGWIGFLDYQFL